LTFRPHRRSKAIMSSCMYTPLSACGVCDCACLSLRAELLHTLLCLRLYHSCGARQTSLHCACTAVVHVQLLLTWSTAEVQRSSMCVPMNQGHPSCMCAPSSSPFDRLVSKHADSAVPAFGGLSEMSTKSQRWRTSLRSCRHLRSQLLLCTTLAPPKSSLLRGLACRLWLTA
jgi:hypothetical protein